MPNIKLIARETLRQLIENKIEPTPEAYEKEFYHQIKKMGIKGKHEPIDINRLVALLKGDAKEIANKSFNNKDELIIFLIKVLNLVYHYRKSFNILSEMEKLFLRLLSTYPDEEISTLATNELVEIDKINFQIKEAYKQRWIEQAQRNLEIKGNDFDKALEFLGDFQIENDEFKDLQKKVKEYLEGSRNKEIGTNLLREIETFFQELALAHAPQQQEEQELKPEMSLKYTDMDSLPINSVTTLISKEGMQDILEFIEEEYEKNKTNYSIIIFGIAGYNQAIKSYGEDALKRVLGILGKFLKKYSNPSDLIAYYGEEKFLACLLGRDREEAIAFIRQLDIKVKKSVFMYQQMRIHIKLSAQVAHRIEEESLEEMLKVTLEEFVKYKDTPGIIDET